MTDILKRLREQVELGTALEAEAADEIERLRAGVNAVLGLIMMVSSRDDMPAALRHILTDNHRIEEARAALGEGANE